MKAKPSAVLALVVSLAALAAPGCSTKHLPHTQIEDTPETRAVFNMVMAYRTAMEERDVDALLGMVSRRYYENAATTERSNDDYGFDMLAKAVIPVLRENIKAVQYRILLRSITVDGERAWADFEYYYNFKYVEGGEEGWSQQNDFNRLEFLLESGVWKIVAGL